MPILVKFEDNYADEFDTVGFRIFENQKELQKWKDRVAAEFDNLEKLRECERAKFVPKYEGEKFYDYGNCVEYGFGSNESLSWNNLPGFVINCTEKVITTGQAEFLVSMFGEEWGIFPDFDNDFDQDLDYHRMLDPNGSYL